MIGHFGGDRIFTDGQTIKTKEIFHYLKEHGFKVSKLDTYYSKKKPFAFLLSLKRMVRENDAIILIVSFGGYRLLAPYLVKINKRYNKKLFDFVIGGTRYRLFDKNKKLEDVASKYTKIYVETDRIKNEYEKRGFKNVIVLPNFKKIRQFPAKKRYRNSHELHCCIFSRVIKEKGIEDAVKAIKIANDSKNGALYYLDIYGPVDEKYKERFNSLMKNKNVFYKGVIKRDESSEVLNMYDVLLFPSYWRNEGFPGTIIDAVFASLPIVATDWNDNFDVLKKDENGLMVNVRDPDGIAKAITKLANDKKLFLKMSSNNHNLAMDYLPNNVMSVFLKELGENDD